MSCRFVHETDMARTYCVKYQVLKKLQRSKLLLCWVSEDSNTHKTLPDDWDHFTFTLAPSSTCGSFWSALFSPSSVVNPIQQKPLWKPDSLSWCNTQHTVKHTQLQQDFEDLTRIKQNMVFTGRDNSWSFKSLYVHFYTVLKKGNALKSLKHNGLNKNESIGITVIGQL